MEQPALRERGVSPARSVWLVPPDTPATLDTQVTPDTRGILDPRAPRVFLERRSIRARLGARGLQDRQVRQVLQGIRVPLVLLAGLAGRVIRALQEIREKRVPRALLA